MIRFIKGKHTVLHKIPSHVVSDDIKLRTVSLFYKISTSKHLLFNSGSIIVYLIFYNGNFRLLPNLKASPGVFNSLLRTMSLLILIYPRILRRKFLQEILGHIYVPKFQADDITVDA